MLKLDVFINSCECFLEPNQCSLLMCIFCNNYSAKLSEFHIHDDLYINTSRRLNRHIISPVRPTVFEITNLGLVAFLLRGRSQLSTFMKAYREYSFYLKKKVKVVFI